MHAASVFVALMLGCANVAFDWRYARQTHTESTAFRQLARSQQSVHNVWDSFPNGSIQYRTARNRDLSQLAGPLMAASVREAAENLNEKERLDESHFRTVAVACDAEVIVAHWMMAGSSDSIQSIRLSDDDRSTGSTSAQQRPFYAGFRSGEVPEEIVAGSPTPGSTLAIGAALRIFGAYETA